MSNLLNQLFRLTLSVSLLDRDTFVDKVSEILEMYKDDPEQMHKVATGIYDYLQDLKGRLDTKAMYRDVIDHSKLPDSKEIRKLSNAIEKLTKELQEQKTSPSDV